MQRAHVTQTHLYVHPLSPLSCVWHQGSEVPFQRWRRQLPPLPAALCQWHAALQTTQSSNKHVLLALKTWLGGKGGGGGSFSVLRVRSFAVIEYQTLSW